MLRQFLRSFERKLLLQNVTKQQCRCTLFSHVEVPTTKSAHASAINTQTTDDGSKDVDDISRTTITTTVIGSEIDQDYVKPYRSEMERGTTASVLLEALRQRFRLNDADVKQIMRDESVQRSYRQRTLFETMDQLSLEGVTKRSFVDYPWLLTLDNKRLTQKLGFLKSLRMRDINDFVPFLRLSVPRLRKLVSALNQESAKIEHGNRVYYISEKLKVSPAIVSKYLAKRLFVLEMPFEMFEQNLQHMIDYNVSPINVLKDLWAFRYTPKSVQMRLERAKRANKDKIMPWMVRCPEPILQRSLKLSLDELEVLGKFSSVVEYLADRLQFSVTDAKAIMDRHPQVHTVRVTKMREILDYLLNEAGFTRYEIAQVPRILCHSLKTTKERIDELKAMGCRPSTLVILCRSKREYAKFLQEWQYKMKFHKQSNQV